MLFGYPIEATHDNWLHECVCGAIRNIHAGVKVLQQWPSVLPAEFRQRPKLSAANSLKRDLQAYAVEVVGLERAELDEIDRIVLDANRIPEILADTHQCPSLGGIRPKVLKALKELFATAYKLLTDLGVRDDHYRIIYDSATDKLCPFCGLEYFDAPGGPRHHLDHYLVKENYPLSAANLRNLVPMGERCNTVYKRTADMLRTTAGERRRALDPYDHGNIRVSLDDSAPLDADAEKRWVITFEPDVPMKPDDPRIGTWDDVFKVRERYQRDVLVRNWGRWLEEFVAYCRGAGELDVMARLSDYIAYLDEMKLSDRSFLKSAVFRMIRARLTCGDGRIFGVIRDVILMRYPGRAVKALQADTTPPGPTAA